MMIKLRWFAFLWLSSFLLMVNACSDSSKEQTDSSKEQTVESFSRMEEQSKEVVLENQRQWASNTGLGLITGVLGHL